MKKKSDVCPLCGDCASRSDYPEGLVKYFDGNMRRFDRFRNFDSLIEQQIFHHKAKKNHAAVKSLEFLLEEFGKFSRHKKLGKSNKQG